MSGRVWQFNFDRKSHTYLSTTHVNIYTTDSTVSESDTLTSIIHFTIIADRAHSPAVISGTVDRAEIKTGNKIGVNGSRIELPVGFEGRINDKKLDLNLTTSPDTHPIAGSPTCAGSATAVLGDIRTLLTTFLQDITAGLQWSDTVSTTTCNSTGITSTVQTLRSYNVLGDTIYFGIEALVLRRTESTDLKGGGAQGQHTVTLTGNGTGLTIIYVDRRGIPLATSTSQNLALVVTISGHSKHFTQHSEQIIKLLD